MKTLLIGLVSILSLQAHTREMNDFKDLFLEAQAQNNKFLLMSNEPPQPNAHPGMMKVKITKNTFVQDADGAYHWDKKSVCQNSVLLEIADARTGPVSSRSANLITCLSSLDGVDKNVNVGGLMSLENTNVFDDEQKVDLKVAGAYMTYGKVASSKESEFTFRYSVSASRDLGQKSFLVSIQPEVICASSSTGSTTPKKAKLIGDSNPTNCTTNEFFSAIVELIDLAPR